MFLPQWFLPVIPYASPVPDQMCELFKRNLRVNNTGIFAHVNPGIDDGIYRAYGNTMTTIIASCFYQLDRPFIIINDYTP